MATPKQTGRRAVAAWMQHTKVQVHHSHPRDPKPGTQLRHNKVQRTDLEVVVAAAVRIIHLEDAAELFFVNATIAVHIEHCDHVLQLFIADVFPHLLDDGLQ